MTRIQTFKKGQIVPRRLGLVLASKRRAQHLIKFGQDCTWDGNRLLTVGEADCMIFLPASAKAGWPTGKRGNGTRQYDGIHVRAYMMKLPDGRAAMSRDRAALERKP